MPIEYSWLGVKRPATIQQPVVSSGVTKWQTLATVFVTLSKQVPQEYAQQMGPTNTVEEVLRTRYRASAPFAPKMRVLYRGRYLEILGVVNVEERDHFVDLLCREAPT